MRYASHEPIPLKVLGIVMLYFLGYVACVHDRFDMYVEFLFRTLFVPHYTDVIWFNTLGVSIMVLNEQKSPVSCKAVSPGHTICWGRRNTIGEYMELREEMPRLRSGDGRV